MGQDPEKYTAAGQVLFTYSHVNARAVIKKGSAPGTVRFDNGQPCCTCVHNRYMDEEERDFLAERIALALNMVRGLTNPQIAELSCNKK
jgi:hypothetical protein